ncbi:MAG: ABC transporter ATP-binding protein [Gemmatimonadaceae bacterium]
MTGIAIRAIEVVRDFKSVRALDRLSLEIPRGIVFGFLGPNGAGKTTAIRTFLGLVEPTSGRAEVLGLDAWRDGAGVRAQSGALLEHSGLYERLTAEQNLEFFGRAWRLPRAERRARIRALLEQFGLWDRRKDMVGTWSRGMRQKLAVARAVLHRPALIFLDEPTAGLDPVASASLRDDLAALSSQEGTTIFLTTHNLSEAERLCSLIGVIRKGRLVAMGSPAELRHQQTGNDVRMVVRGGDELMGSLGAELGVGAVRHDNGAWIVSLVDGASPAPIVRWLVERGADVEECSRERASLEDAFLDILLSETGAEGQV